MEIGLIGLGRMGMNMAKRLLQDQHRVVVFNRTVEKIKILEAQGAQGVKTIADLVSHLKTTPRVIWLMVSAGQATEDLLHELLTFLKPGDIVIEGGNAFYQDSMRRFHQCAERHIHFLDVGTSGGIWGLQKGYCLMIGGPIDAFKHVEPIFKSLAPPQGYAHVGASGAGHFVKMIHNGIEYALLQAYGEGFEIMQSKSEFNLNLKQIANLWNQGSVVRSWLLELAEYALSEDPDLKNIAGYVEDSGEGRWTVQEAIAQHIDAPTIVLSLLQRFRSRQTESFSAKLIAALRQQFGGHAIKKKES